MLLGVACSDPKCPKPELAPRWFGSNKGRHGKMVGGREKHANITQLSVWTNRIRGMHNCKQAMCEQQQWYDRCWARNLHEGKVVWGTLANKQLYVKESDLWNWKLGMKLDRGLFANKFYPQCNKPSIFAADSNPTMHDILVTCKDSVVTEYTGSLLAKYDATGVQQDTNLTHKASMPSMKADGAGSDLSLDSLEQSNALVLDSSDGCYKPGIKKHKSVHVSGKSTSLADPLSDNYPTQERVTTYGPTIDPNPNNIHYHMGLGGIANSVQDLKVPYNCRPVYVRDEVHDFKSGETKIILRMFLVACKGINPHDEILWKYYVKYSRFGE